MFILNDKSAERPVMVRALKKLPGFKALQVEKKLWYLVKVINDI